MVLLLDGFVSTVGNWTVRFSPLLLVRIQRTDMNVESGTVYDPTVDDDEVNVLPPRRRE